MANEKLIERNLTNRVKKLGGWCLKFWPISVAGFPDRIVLLSKAKERIYFVELKSTGKKPLPIQEVIHKKLRRLGFRVDVIDGNEQLNEYTKFLQNEITE